MSRLVKSFFINRNSAGLLSRITKTIFESNINILRSQMVKSDNEFIYKTECMLDKHSNNTMNGIIGKYYKYDMPSNLYAKKQIHGDPKKFNIDIKYADSPELIHEYTRILSGMDMDIEIETLQSGIDIAPMTGVYIFNMKIQIITPNNVTTDELVNNLNVISDRLGVELVVRPL